MASRKDALTLLGFRSLTASEARSLGLKPGGSGRRYVALNTKRVTAATPTFTRRKLEEPILGTTFEGVRDINYQRRIAFRQPRPVGGVGGTRYKWALENYAYVHNVSIGQARNSREFQQLYKWLKNSKKYRNGARPAVNERNLRAALVRLGLRDPSWTWAVGDTPDGLGGRYQDSIATGALSATMREQREAE